MRKCYLLSLVLLSLALQTRAEEVAYAVFDATAKTLTFRYDDGYDSSSDVQWEVTNTGTSNPGWVNKRTQIVTAVFDASFAAARPQSCYTWFYKMDNLERVDGLTNLNTSEVTTMQGMFSQSPKLTTLDLSHFDTSLVTNMQHMFYSCSALESVYVGRQWTVKQVTNSTLMFYYCYAIVGEDGTTYANNVWDKTPAHYGSGGYLREKKYAYALFNATAKTLTFRYDGDYDSASDVQWLAEDTGTSNPGWVNKRTQIVTAVFDASFAAARPQSCYTWFYKMDNLERVDGLTNLNTSEVTTMQGMFSQSPKLTTLDLSHFDTSQVTTMQHMFYQSGGLSVLDLSSFDTSSVTDMYYMFNECTALTTLDLSSFDLTAVETMNRMFRNCTNLATVIVGEQWAVPDVTNGDYMFYNCSAIVGEDGTTLGTKTDKTRAHCDAGGYLTRKTVEVTANAIGTDYWTTYYKSHVNRQADANTTVYTVALQGSSLTMDEVADRTIQGGQGVVLKSTGGTITLTSTVAAPQADYSDNALLGSDVQTPNPDYGRVYVLNNKSAGLGFYKLSASGRVGANKAYLYADAAAARDCYLFQSDDITTGMASDAFSERPAASALSRCYDLLGRPASVRGLHILRPDGQQANVKGRKVIVR